MTEAAAAPSPVDSSEGTTDGPSETNVVSLNSTVQYTVAELAAHVGMSTRNIRAHQARRLLHPPNRKGRVAMYDDAHVQRLEAIKALQKQGFNLVSIEAILGPRSNGPGMQALIQVLERLAADRPSLVYALSRHDVLARDECGDIHVRHPKAVRAALGLRRVGMPVPRAASLLGEVLDSMRSVAEGLVRSASSRSLTLLPNQTADADGPASWEELDRDTAVLAECIVAVLVESFRVVAENSARHVVSDLIAERSGPELGVDVVSPIDSG